MGLKLWRELWVANYQAKTRRPGKTFAFEKLNTLLLYFAFFITALLSISYTLLFLSR